jgi:hypothetical protein
MDPFVVETINSWRDYMLNLGDKSKKSILSVLLNNIGVALSNPRNTSTDFHYDSGFVHCYRNKSEPLITFEVHPPRRCFVLLENFEEIVLTINKIRLTRKDCQSALARKYNVENINLNFSDPTLIAAQVISQMHNAILKKEQKTSDLFLTPFLAEKIYSDAKTFRANLNYIVDTYRDVDYWDPDKKR